MMVLCPLFFAATLAFTGGALAHIHGKAAGWIGAVALACVPYFEGQGSAGDADVPLALMAVGSIMFLWRWLRAGEGLSSTTLSLSGARRALVLSAVLAGLAAWTKKEGTILLGLTALVVVVASYRRRHAEQRWQAILADLGAFIVPGLITAGPWLIYLIVRRPLTRDFLPVTLADPGDTPRSAAHYRRIYRHSPAQHTALERSLAAAGCRGGAGSATVARRRIGNIPARFAGVASRY